MIISHGDSLLLPALRRPVIRVMHGSAIDEARAATALHRRVLQRGVHVLELLTSMTQLSVGVSAATQRSNRWVNRVIHNGVDLSVFHEDAAARDRTPGDCVCRRDGRAQAWRVAGEAVCGAHPAGPAVGDAPHGL